MPSEKANVEKIVIKGFLDKKQQDEMGISFTIPVNPESYARTYKIENESGATAGNQGGAPKYKGTAPEQLKLDFTLDNTGTIEGNILNGTPVPKQIDQLVKVVYNMQGESHRPGILKIVWGSFFVFDCVLASLEINYVLFNPQGTPLRAKISATFTQYIAPEKRVEKEKKKSPDLTRVIKITNGDSLPLLTYRSYGDATHYMKVAKANNLVSFRPLRAGDELVFPPIRQVSENQTVKT
ncbi:CIS tube protein [Chitinophaga defluvii]|uniref:Contractile injection system tube protein N-terminal domain-containing protein n=1 Tax=Chitinophaga defluvii TaxID=3163343 RepID=A0ABV2T2U3_9BACT